MRKEEKDATTVRRFIDRGVFARSEVDRASNASSDTVLPKGNNKLRLDSLDSLPFFPIPR